MRITDLAGKRVGVWGAGREGMAAVRALGPGPGWPGAAEIVLHTDSPPPAGEKLPDGVIRVHGADGVAELGRCDVVVRSPGVSRYRPEVAALIEQGVKVTTGNNLWFAETAALGSAGTTVAITGTKGKSTTSSLIAHLIAATGAPVALRGNIGLPLLDGIEPGVVDRRSDLTTVIEMSSYQTSDFAGTVDIAVFTNIYSEHIPWHGSTEMYRRDKLRLAKHARRIVANRTDGRLANAFPLDRRVTWFGIAPDWHVDGNGIERGAGDSRLRIEAADLPIALRDPHMLLNLCAALTVTGDRFATAGEIVAALQDFKPLPHRLQDLGTVDSPDGRSWRYVNDSIATAPEAVVAALDSMRLRYTDQPVVLLAGGHDRQQGYELIAARVVDDPAVVGVVGLPDTGSRVIAEIGALDHPPATLVLATDMADAVAKARNALPDGGVILLSPGAPSFGAYRDFEERGRDFARQAGLPFEERKPS